MRTLKPYLNVLLVALIISLTGCFNGVQYFNSSDEAHCSIDCSKRLFIADGYSRYGNYCECVSTSSLLPFKSDDKPKDFREYNTENIKTITSSSTCYKNNIQINCSEIK